MAIPGSGDYLVQPVYVGDVADLAVQAGQKEENIVLDAAGPETYAFSDLVSLIAGAIGTRRSTFHLPPRLALFALKALGALLRDVVLTRDEIQGLMASLLVSGRPPLGQTRPSQWLGRHSQRLGARYASELRRHYRRG